MATQTYTDGVSLTAAAEFNLFDSAAYAVLSSVSGTNTITATGPANYTYAATRPAIFFVPANTNTAATTINITPSGGAALGARNIFWNGAACVGGELRQNVPAALIDDGTRFHIIANGFGAPFLDTYAIVEGSADSTKKVRFEVDGLTTATTRVITPPDKNINLGITLGTSTSASGTAVDFTSIPSGVSRITIMLFAVSTNGTSRVIVQLGDGGGVETAGYSQRSHKLTAGTIDDATTAFGIYNAPGATDAMYGQIILNRVTSSHDWVMSSTIINITATTDTNIGGGHKQTSAELDRVRITMANGTDTFDAGTINISYEF
ncbi:MAG TPA: hypothetical protein VGK99_05425 [Acidobacteriota bacterium]